jgi:hypothetical protein
MGNLVEAGECEDRDRLKRSSSGNCQEMFRKGTVAKFNQFGKDILNKRKMLVNERRHNQGLSIY